MQQSVSERDIDLDRGKQHQWSDDERSGEAGERSSDEPIMRIETRQKMEWKETERPSEA